MAKPPSGCADELKTYEKLKARRKDKRWLSKDRKAARKKEDAAKDRYKACVKARDDIAVLMLMRATLRVRKDLGMKTPIDWKKIPVEKMSAKEELRWAKIWKKQSLAACVDPIMVENKKLGITNLVGQAVAAMMAARVAKAWSTAGKIALWIIIASALVVAAFFAWPAIAGAGAAAGGGGAAAGGAAAASGGAAAAGGTAAAGTTVAAGAGGTGLVTAGGTEVAKTFVVKGAKEVAKREITAGAKKAVTQPGKTVGAIQAITKAGGSVAGGKLTKVAEEAEESYQVSKQGAIEEIEQKKAIAASKGQKLTMPVPDDTVEKAGAWYTDPKILTGIGVGVGAIAIIAVAARK